jgi:NitT/TauT family transport system substrate-binding protein
MNRPGRVGRARRGSVRAVGLLAAGMAVLLTAGCGLFGGGSESDSSSEPAANASGKLEKTEVRVGVMPTIDCSGAQLALLNKAFEEEGLTVKPETLQSGAFGVLKMRSGELDISFGNWVSFIKAQESKSDDLRFVSESYLSTPNSNFVVLAAPNSGISSVKDLVGKTIAVNALGNINELLIRAVLDANDVNFEDVTLVEMKFPDMLPTLQNGGVDAISVIDPFSTQAQMTFGAKVVFDMTGQGNTEHFPLSGFATSAKFAKENPNTIAAFQRGLAKGQQLAADRKNVQEALPKFARMDPETAAVVRFGSFPTTIDAKRIQRVSDLLSTYGMLGSELQVAPLVIAAPSSNN